MLKSRFYKGLILLIWLSIAFNGYGQTQKLNILLIMADDLSYSDISPYGNKYVKTPNLQKLADSGMSLDHMYTGTAMCSPTRQQILTGIYPIRNGAFPNHTYVYPGTKSIATYLQQAGYQTAIIGKRDIGNQESFPFQFLGGKNGDNGKGRDIKLEDAEKFIKECGNKPYFLEVASNQPHVPWTRGNPKLYPPSKVLIPQHMEDTEVTREALSKYYAEVTYLDSLVGVCLDIVERSGKKDNTLIVFTSEHGAQFPFSKWTCYNEGLKTAFIAKWPRKIPANTRNLAMTEYVDVVPTLLEAVGVNPKEIHTGNKDAFGYDGFDGESFLNVLLNKTQTFKKGVFGIQTTHGIINGTDNYPVRSYQTYQFLYIKNLNYTAKFSSVAIKNPILKSWYKKDDKRADAYVNRPAVELYNIIKDPYQLNNLAGNAQYKIMMKGFDQELEKFMKQQGDEGMKTEAKAEARHQARLAESNGEEEDEQ